MEIYDLYKYALAFIEIDKTHQNYFFSKDLTPFFKNATFIITFQKKELKQLFQVFLFFNHENILYDSYNMLVLLDTNHFILLYQGASLFCVFL